MNTRWTKVFPTGLVPNKSFGSFCCRRRHRQYRSSMATSTAAEAPKRYNSLQETDLQVFSQILNQDPSTMFYHPTNHLDVLQAASQDWTGHYTQSRTHLVLRPRTTEQISKILKHCHERYLPIVPQGGNTSLVGGSVPTQSTLTSSLLSNEIVLQLQHMNQILTKPPDKDTSITNSTTTSSTTNLHGIVHCQAGVVLQTLQDYCATQFHLKVPLDLGSKGSCQIGGNIATNAGGPLFYRYKGLSANVIGLELVLANGNILNLNFTKKVDHDHDDHQENNNNNNNNNNIIMSNFKDNTGYKLHQLFIGSEGTLGIITGVALACTPIPKSQQAAYVVCSTYQKVLCVMQKAQQYLGEIVAAMEFMDSTIWRLLEESGQHTMPMSIMDHIQIQSDDHKGGAPFFLLIDTHGSNMEHDQAKWEQFLEAIETDILNGVMAQDVKQYQSFWRIRESANPCIARLGYTYKYDVSLSITQFQDWIQEMQHERLNPLKRKGLVNSNWGHILDGNLHFNVTTIGEHDPQPEVLDALEPYLFQSILKRGGSISAEHGLGQAKNHLLSSVHDTHTLEVMQSIKAMLDPHGILNPGKVFPSDP